ncbi:TIP120-domain-containing protein [Viridothelium virens]|uniref:TIP120-domain-containing protein n=1 Tax=Viridothelium virens TaxID=1048519 RepID=A0A6A6H5W3_VIRVR|nr:TIP120-domain-containing protein [Viridothelium virens]
MSTSIPQNPSSANVATLLPKLHDADADFRYMALNDLQQILNNGHATFLSSDYTISAKTVDGLLHTLNDTNGEVQNMAVKCLGPFVTKAPDTILGPMIDKISNLQTGNTVDNSVPALALRAVVVSLPRPLPGVPRSKAVQDAHSAITKVLIPRLVGYNVVSTGRKDLPKPPKGLLQVDMENGTDSNAIDVLTEVARCFGPMLQEPEIYALQKITSEIIESDRSGSVLRKKAVIAMSVLASYFSDSLLSSFLSHLIESLRNPHLTPAKRKLYITILGSMARSIPRKFGPYLKTLCPFVISALSADELDSEMADSENEEERDPQVDEAREAALTALEAFLSSCGPDMIAYIPDSIDAALRFLKYDPNYNDEEDDDEMGGTRDEDEDNEFDQDEDFEEEAGFDDEDDISWKVRRCAAKVIYTIITMHGSGDLLENGTLYSQIAPALISRFKEREENVRLEVLSSLTALVRRTGEEAPMTTSTTNGVVQDGLMGPPPSRKRRRVGSDASMFDTPTQLSLASGYVSPPKPVGPKTGPQASLAQISPDIVRGVSKLLKTSSQPTKQASLTLLKDIVIAEHGGLSSFLDQIVTPLLEALSSSVSSTGASAATANNLRIEALHLVAVIAEAHPSKDLEPYLAKIVPALAKAIKDRFSKVAVAALNAAEQCVKALTPPRSESPSQNHSTHLERLYDMIVDRIPAQDTDTEVKSSAVHSLGLLLGRTSGPQGASLLHRQKRFAGLELLQDRMKNELTRLASVRAVDAVAALAQDKNEFMTEWVTGVALELGAQLRKASRSLRGSSLATLRMLVANPATRAHLDEKTVEEVVSLLLPLLTSNDLHLLGPALIILATLAKNSAANIINDNTVKAICFVGSTPLSDPVVDALLILVRSIGEQGAGGRLMQAFLKDVGVGGNPDLTGKVIGTLLVFGGPSVGVKLDDFINELRTAKDDQRKCLALSVLGEAGLRMGTSSPLQPDLFTNYFAATSDKVPLAAAVALGRAGAGNIKTYLPVILSTMGGAATSKYLLLHSVREILQHSEAEADIIPYANDLWQNIVAASKSEDNRAIGSECIGRLAIIDPKVYIPQLQTFLTDSEADTRGMVISALRYTFADSDSSYDTHLKPSIISMLTTMLNDPSLEDRRLALTTFTSAAHNKPDLISPHFPTLIPLAIKETLVRPELVREVQMGPFKHKVDDGLELRKSAYETLYGLMDTAFPHLSPLLPNLYDRVVAGITDEHDIRVLCLLMFGKLLTLAPEEESVRRLEQVAKAFRSVLSQKPKENAVKQDLERMQEQSKGVVKASVLVSREVPAAEGSGMEVRDWRDYWEWVKKEFPALVKAAEDELREKDR